MLENLFHESHQKFMERIRYIANEINESLSDPDKSSGPKSTEFRLLKLFFRGKDNALDERWIPQQVEVYRKSKDKPFGVMIQYLRSLKGLESLSLETIRDITYIYYYYHYTYLFFEDGETLDDNKISKINERVQPSMGEFVTVFRGSHDSDEDHCWSCFYSTIIRAFEFTLEKFKGDVKSEFFKLALVNNAAYRGLDLAVIYLDMMFSRLNRVRGESLPEFCNVDQLWDRVGQLTNKRNRGLKEADNVVEEESHDDSSKEEVNWPEEYFKSLKAPATAIILRAINKAEPGSVDVSVKGVTRAVKNFNIPYHGGEKNLYNYTQNGGDKDPNRNSPLRTAEKWLSHNGFIKAEKEVKRWLSEI